MTNKCNECGICCKLFLINLNKSEYLSGKYKTVFGYLEGNLCFSEARKNGANILAQNIDGSCIYLNGSQCRIHSRRPQVCRNFFCSSKSKKLQQMINQI